MGFNPTEYNVSEGDGGVVLTLVATAPAAVDYTVGANTFNGTAKGELLVMKHSHSALTHCT